jgi:hypothetical protein
MGRWEDEMMGKRVSVAGNELTVKGQRLQRRAKNEKR